jgi:hypothetical protein
LEPKTAPKILKGVFCTQPNSTPLCCHHFDRDARDRHVGSKTGGQFNWFGPDGASVRAMVRKIIHSGWQKNSEGCSLHVSIGGHETQSRPQGQISSSDQSRKATESSPNGAHAKTNRTRQRPYQSRSKLGEKGGLIKTDTRFWCALLVSLCLFFRSPALGAIRACSSNFGR